MQERASRRRRADFSGRVLVAGPPRGEHTELVAFRVAQDDPCLLTLADVDASGAEVEEASHGRIPVVGPEVEVETVLERLRLRDAGEQQSG